MIYSIDAYGFNRLVSRFPVIDVRSPGEYNQGHLPGAFNIPVFDNDERAEIGRLYAQNDPGFAIIKGIDIALEKMDQLHSQINLFSGSGSVLLHCWRGGMRSAAMAAVFQASGIGVFLLKGGYKAWRTYIRAETEKPRKVIILGGFTGSGKTRLLKTLSGMGEQVIDLEALARHKGSVFGALDQDQQPTNEQFENEFFTLFEKFSQDRHLWLEDESRMIGNITLSEPLFKILSTSPVIMVEVPYPVRLENLVREYSGFNREFLAAALKKIGPRIGGNRLNMALDSLRYSDFYTVADIALTYYDKAYTYSLERRSSQIFPVEISGIDDEGDAKKILELNKKMQRDDPGLS